MNQDQGVSEIQKQFFESFHEKIFPQFEKYGALISCFDDRNFTERQSYGLVVTSLADNEGVDFVLSEVGVVRNGDVNEKKSSGRVDYLIGFRGWLFLVELKLKFVRLGRLANAPKNCVDAWDGSNDGVVEQLSAIENTNNPVLQEIINKRKYPNGVVKFPILIVMYASDSEKESLNDEQKEKIKSGLKGRHSKLAEQLNCAFNKYYQFDNTITRCHTRRNSPTPCYRTTYGVGIMAGAKFK